MTCRPDGTLVIVFGAGGRLGQALLPILDRERRVVVAVARRQKPPNQPRNVHWIQVDVTEVAVWERSLRVFCGMADFYEHVVIVDLLNDRASVTATRSPVTTGTSYIIRLTERLAAENRPSSLVLASTTAVTAPRPRPARRVRRRQLARYVSAGVMGQALLLPRLVDGDVDLYTAAAMSVARSIADVESAESIALRLVVPALDVLP